MNPAQEIAQLQQRMTSARHGAQAASSQQERERLEQLASQCEQDMDQLLRRVPRPACYVAADLRGPEGDPFAIMGRVCRTLSQEGEPDLVPVFQQLATSGDYEQLMAAVDRFVVPLVGVPPRPVRLREYYLQLDADRG